MMTQNDLNPATRKRKIKPYIITLFIVIIAAAVLLPNIRGKATQPIRKNDTQQVISWKSAGLSSQGKVIPDTCALTNKNCTCNLTKTNTKCTFNFTFEGLDEDAAVQVSMVTKLSAIKYTVSSGCSSNNTDKIENCVITYEWDKTQTGNVSSQIIIASTNGAESL